MSDSAKPQRPPSDLRVRGKKLWQEVMAEFTLRPDERSNLHEWCRTLDLIDKLEAELRDGPLMMPGSAGQASANPLLRELRGLRAVAASYSRLMALSDVPDVDEQGQAQPTPSQIRGKRASDARWGHRGRA